MNEQTGTTQDTAPKIQPHPKTRSEYLAQRARALGYFLVGPVRYLGWRLTFEEPLTGIVWETRCPNLDAVENVLGRAEGASA